MATSSGEPRPKRARVDRSDADAKLDKAEKDYAEAKNNFAEKEQQLAEREKKLEAALHTQSRDNDLIQVLKEAVQTAKEAVQNAEKDKEFAQKMLLQSKLQPEVQYDIVEKVKDLVKPLATVVLNMATVQPIPAECRRTSTGTGWTPGVRKYYELGSDELVCSVLSRLFPQTMEEYKHWARHLGWGSPFPAVVEHIVPKSQPTSALSYGFNVWEPCNGFPLLKDIELKYQEGHLSITPTSADPDPNTGIELVVHVSQKFHSTFVEYKQDDHRRLPKDRGVKVVLLDGRQRWLQFGDLHEQTFRMRKTPSMRALYLKAMMAWQETQKNGHGIPNPALEENHKNFVRHCSRLGDLLTRALHHVPP
mmetsp:Transcript_43624/g.60603  ORF Transcript_43624/g.60603 Transcript_43624/m.60603 type:complete len:363 (+) Transcript_43624:131-1219(+)